MAEQLQSATAHLDRLLTDMRSVLADARLDGSADTDVEPIHGAGSAADGLVRVTAVAGGRIEGLTVDPRLLRQGLESICEHVTTAVNAALQDLHGKVAGVSTPTADLPALSTRLADLQDHSVRQMALMSQALGEAVARIRGGG